MNSDDSDLVHVLRTWGRQRAGELLERLGVSRPTLMRAVRAAGDAVVVRGAARRTAYAARRSLRGSTAPLPLYRIDEHGAAHEQGLLYPTVPDGSALSDPAALDWPMADADMADGWFDGLPYPLLDMRPQGFLGRNFARANAAILQVDDDPQRWSDDDALHALSLLGVDTPGDFILGEPAYRLWLDGLRAPAEPVADDVLPARYAAAAEDALRHGVVGSSAGGEFPKFTTTRRRGAGADEVEHVLVKFSGNDDAEGTRRWADLLVCEHLAAGVVRDELGIPAARTTIHQGAGRTFLEVVRFDRHGAHGRSGLLSLLALHAAFVGSVATPWPASVRRLDALGLLRASALPAATALHHFGRLIANTDMHEGNLSFQPPPAGDAGGGLRLAPAYDMLPMFYAPSRGVEVVARAFEPGLPLPADKPAWRPAAAAAGVFWDAVAGDARVSAGFRRVAAENADSVRRLAAHPAAR